MPAATWKLQDAKAQFSEVVRRARSEGPQRVTVHGKDSVVVVSADEFTTLTGGREEKRTGAALVQALRDPRFRGFSVERERVYSPVRETPRFEYEDTGP
jgi:prevent-host-death family protein